jgi:hypothetical protein
MSTLCLLCKTCDKNTQCYCVRCPMNPDRNISCPVCCADNCADSQCVESARTMLIIEHFECTHEIYCQTCEEAKHNFKMPYQQLGMYCNEHEMEHKHLMRLSTPAYFREDEDFLDASGGGYIVEEVKTEDDVEEDLEELEKERETELAELIAKAEQFEYFMDRLADVSTAEFARNAAAKIRESISNFTTRI